MNTDGGGSRLNTYHIPGLVRARNTPDMKLAREGRHIASAAFDVPDAIARKVFAGLPDAGVPYDDVIAGRRKTHPHVCLRRGLFYALHEIGYSYSSIARLVPGGMTPQNVRLLAWKVAQSDSVRGDLQRVVQYVRERLHEWRTAVYAEQQSNPCNRGW